MLILISDAFDASLPGRLKKHGEVTDDHGRLAEAEVVLIRSKTKVNKEYIDSAPKMKLVIRGGVGLDNVDIPYARSKGAGTRFYPDLTTKDIVVATTVILVLVLLARFVGAGLEPPADPTDTSYVPRPEWYFLPFFELLKLVPGSLESLVAVGIPAVLILVLFALPFFDRSSVRAFSKRPIAQVALTFLLGSSALLLARSYTGEQPDEVVVESGRPLTSVERSGKAIFGAQQCGSCHAVAGKGGGSQEDAPNLSLIGLRHSGAWIHSFIENPLRFHPDSKMPSYGPPTISHQDIEELTRYLVTLRGPNGELTKPEFVDTFPELSKPKEK